MQVAQIVDIGKGGARFQVDLDVSGSIASLRTVIDVTPSVSPFRPKAAYLESNLAWRA